ncbi:MAG TPA: ABC transporter ATP-binding protein [Ktedonobacterales bacterium]
MAVAHAIDIHGIGKSYQQTRRAKHEQPPALQDISLRLETGAILGLLGPNGAGKTTLIKVLAGLLRPDAGGGSVLGYDLLRQHNQIRAHVGLVAPTADVGIDNNLTVRQNLAFWAPIYGLHGAHARARIDDLLERLGLSQKAEFWPMHISAGQRQRLALARSLLAETPLLFLDEPTNKLDLEGVRSVRQMIAELNREQGVTIVLTTHVMEEAEELCGEIALLNAGRLVAHRSTTELMRQLHVTRPIAVALRDGARLPEGWQAEVGALPGVVAVEGGEAPDGATLQAQSVDLRASTPALLAWIRAHRLTLGSMSAEPVTLTDVFRRVAERFPPQEVSQ